MFSRQMTSNPVTLKKGLEGDEMFGELSAYKEKKKIAQIKVEKRNGLTKDRYAKDAKKESGNEPL